MGAGTPVPDAQDPCVIAAYETREWLRDSLGREPNPNEMRAALLASGVDRGFVEAYFPHRPKYDKEPSI